MMDIEVYKRLSVAPLYFCGVEGLFGTMPTYKSVKIRGKRKMRLITEAKIVE